MIHPLIVKDILREELLRWKITEARLRRHVWRTYRIPRRRVEEVLHHGMPGHLKAWTRDNIRDWIDMIQTTRTTTQEPKRKSPGK